MIRAIHGKGVNRAEVICDGCMWGWVARIREAEYGPDLRWAEIDSIRDDLAAATRQAVDRGTALDADLAARLKDATDVYEAGAERIRVDLTAQIEALQKRVNALVPATGPKSGRV